MDRSVKRQMHNGWNNQWHCIWCLEEFYKCLGSLTALKWASTHRRTQTACLTQHGTCKKQRRATLIVLVWRQHKFKTGHVQKEVDDNKKIFQIITFLTKTPKPCFVPLLSTWLAAYKVNKSFTCLLWEKIGIRMPTSSEGQKQKPKTNQHSREWTEGALGDDEFIWNKTVKHFSLMMAEKKTFTSSNSIWATEVLCVQIQSR